MKILSTLIVMMFLSCGGEKRECDYNSDCASPNETCSKVGKCQILFPPPGPLSEGSMVIPCSCDPRLFVGDERENMWCISGIDVAVKCKIQYECGETLTRVCK